MNIVIAIVVVLLLLVAYYSYTNKQQNMTDIGDLEINNDMSAMQFAEVKKQNTLALLNQAPSKEVAERGLLDENLAYFATPQCPKEGEKDYSVSKDGEQYMNYVGDQLITAEMRASHEEYVSSDVPLLGTGHLITSDMHDSYDPIPWRGLFRPQAVPVYSPDQVSDIDVNLYSKHPTIRW